MARSEVIMTRITKKQLEDRIKTLEAENQKLNDKIATLEKEKLELKVRLEYWENLPANAQKICGDLWTGLISVAFPPQPQGQQK